MFCQKEEIDHVLGNHKGARDHLVSKLLFTLNELQGRMLIVRRFQNKTTYFLAKKPPLSFSNFVVYYTEYLHFICRVRKPSFPVLIKTEFVIGHSRNINIQLDSEAERTKTIETSCNVCERY